MRGLADPDSKIYSLLNKAAMLMELNLLVLLCCLPVVTAGAALCSMHTLLLKIYRGEEKHIVSDFFHAMKSNWKRASALWALFFAYLGVLAGLWLGALALIPEGAVYVLFAVLLAVVLGMVCLDWALILQSRYDYTVRESLKNALLAWLQYPGSTFVYLIGLVIPVVLCCAVMALPVFAFLGVTLPHFLSTTLYSRVFDELEGVTPKIPEL